METNADNQLQRPNRCGSNNPMYGRKHSDESKRKMSRAAKEREAEYRRLMTNQQTPMSMDEFLQENPTVREYIKSIVRESIKNVLYGQKEKTDNRRD